MPGEATTEGSIVAYLRLNDSDWNATLDRAEAKARELAGINPDIRVTAETATALAKLDELRAAEDRVGGITTSHVNTVVTQTSIGGHDSDAALQASQEKVVAAAAAQADEAIRRLKEAQEAENASMREASMLALKESIMMQALDAAERGAAEGAQKNAVAQDASAAATTGAGNAASKGAGYTTLIAGAIAAAIPLATALTGAAVGLAGGLAGMGAAGVLAILGVKEEMAAGTAVGNEYSANLQVLLADLHQLETTAADGVLTGFNRSLAAIQDSMPALNSDIAVFSKELGTATSFLTSGMMTAFQVLNPLFVQAGFYVEQLAAGFAKWTQDGGLARFTQMAIQALPEVTNALGALLNGAMNLISGFSGMGGAMLGILTLAGDLLSLIGSLSPAFSLLGYGIQGVVALVDLLVSGLSLLGPVLPGLATGAAVVGVAFLAWNYAIQPLLTKMGVLAAETTATAVAAGVEAAAATDAAAATTAWGAALDFATGPIGIILAVLGTLAGTMFAVSSATNQAATATQNYTAAVQQDNGVIGLHTKAQAADALQKAGALALAKQLGVATTTLTNAVTTDDTARKKLVATLQAEVQAGTKVVGAGKASTVVHSEQAVAAQKLLDVINNTHVAVGSAMKAYNELAAAEGTATISTKAQLQAQTDLASRYGMTLPALLTAQGAQQQVADQAKAATQAMQLENDAAGLLTNAFNLLNGTNLSVAQAQTAAAAATNTFTSSITTNGTEIDGNSAKAIANQQALQGKAAADQAAAEAVAKQTGSTEAGTAAFGASKVALEAQLKAAGNLTPAIQALIDKYYAVPPVVKTKAELDAAAALAALDAYKAKLASIHDQTVTLTVVTNNVGAPAAMPANVTGGAYKSAHGGPVPAYRAGGGGVGYFAAGGDDFWQPQGTDTVRAMLSPGEFVVKQKSAAYNPQFMSAYNDDPARALASVGGGHTTVSLKGATILMSVDGQQMTAIIQDQIVQAGRRQGMNISTGRQRGA